MKITLRLFVVLLITAFAGFSKCYAAADTVRVEMPLNINYDNNRVTPYLGIEVNGVKFNVIFDTGSHGLKVLKGALAKTQTQQTGRRMHCSFGSAVGKQIFLKGDVMKASFSAGGLSASIKIMSVDSAEYGSGPWQTTGDSALIQSNHFRGYPAIMGVGLRAEGREGVGSPLAQLPGNGKYIIKFPRYGREKGGALIINPINADLTGFLFYHLPAENAASPDYPGWEDNKLLGALMVDNDTYSQFTLLDTGNPDTQIYATEISSNTKVAAGSTVTLKIMPEDKKEQTSQMSFTVGQHREAGKDAVYLRNGAKPKNIFGTMLFFNFDVLYDQKNGVIGLRKK